jgi:hypothetical protein
MAAGPTANRLQAIMRLMVVYIVLLVIGEFIAVRLGLYLDGVMPALSLPIALGLFFSVLVAMWPLAVALSDRFFPSST